MQGQTGYGKGSYTTLDGVTHDAYIETDMNWNSPFESIRVKTNLNDKARTLPTTQLMKLTISPHYEFVRQMIWKAPVRIANSTQLNYTQKETAFLQVVGYGKASLFTYFEGTTQRIVYQTKPNRFIELVPPPSSESPSGKPLDYKDQIRADFKSSFYQEKDLKQLPFTLSSITEFVRNYNSYLPGDDDSVAYSEVIPAVKVPREESEEGLLTEVPFVIVEKSPVYPGCEKLTTEEEIKACFIKELDDFFDQHFKYPKEAPPADISKRIFVQFLFEKDGSVQTKALRVSHSSIEKELQRIFKKIPKLKPGMMNNNPASVIYSHAFKVREKK